MGIQSIDSIDILNKEFNKCIAHWDKSSLPPNITEEERELHRKKFFEFCNTKFHADETLDLSNMICIFETGDGKPIKMVFNEAYLINEGSEDLSNTQE